MVSVAVVGIFMGQDMGLHLIAQTRPQIDPGAEEAYQAGGNHFFRLIDGNRTTLYRNPDGTLLQTVLKADVVSQDHPDKKNSTYDPRYSQRLLP
jgi:hypothetical protein